MADRQDNDSRWLRNESRIRMRSVPTFPIKQEKLADYTSTKPKICSRNSKYRQASPGISMPVHQPINFRKSTKTTIDRHSTHYQPSVSTVQVQTHNVKKFSRMAKTKLDTSDPTPWKHRPRDDIDALTEPEGFLINPRFRRLAHSHTFQSIHELRGKTCGTELMTERTNNLEENVPKHVEQQKTALSEKVAGEEGIPVDTISPRRTAEDTEDHKDND